MTKTVTYDETKWQLVPKEITPEIDAALVKSLPWGAWGNTSRAKVYDAILLAAVPKEPK